MSTDLKTPPDASVTTLVSGIINDAQALVKQQFELLQHEVRTDLRKTKEAGVLLVAGAGLALPGVIVLALMLSQLLQWAVPSLPMWACYGISGFPFLIAGAGLLYAGKVKFESFTTMPTESIEALKENMQWIANRK
jgi:hypothetical protein